MEENFSHSPEENPPKTVQVIFFIQLVSHYLKSILTRKLYFARYFRMWLFVNVFCCFNNFVCSTRWMCLASLKEDCRERCTHNRPATQEWCFFKNCYSRGKVAEVGLTVNLTTATYFCDCEPVSHTFLLNGGSLGTFEMVMIDSLSMQIIGFCVYVNFFFSQDP